ncbi:hypothetical protein ACJ72_08035 [Emergomyces africanus]|uniref:Carboxylesterase type B domain-containing protein n=1 Tax=Emergomyces africanus TaxID=1955775 RepID=A0A1B7NLI0_9EURO|nr:hypothetical protein ACJ72_08035 [Emergomyces africanus]
MPLTSRDPMAFYETVRGKDERFIYVSSNYRMGLFGFASSAKEHMDANIGIYDVLAALEWTKRYIYLFGGDPNRITAFGHGAGAAMITTILTGPKSIPLPFNKAILLSPTLMPDTSSKCDREALWDEIVEDAHCTSGGLRCIMTKTEDELMALNADKVKNGDNISGGGSFGPWMGFVPVNDGFFFPKPLPLLLAEGRVHPELQAVLTSNTMNEGEGLAEDEHMPEYFSSLVRRPIPYATNNTVKMLHDRLPPYQQPKELAWNWITASWAACNSMLIARAYAKIGGGRGKASRFIFSVPPGLHGSDLAYLMGHDQSISSDRDSSMANRLLPYIKDFIVGNSVELPILPGKPHWPLYGPPADIMNFKEQAMEVTFDPWDKNGFCDAFVEALKNRKGEEALSRGLRLPVLVGQ